MPTPREIRLPAIHLEATFEPKTVDADKRTVELRWYSGARIERFSFFDGPFTMAFSMDAKAVRLGRLNSGKAPLKAGHAMNSDLGGVAGVVERAWMDQDGGHALVRFSERAEVEPIFRDVQAGILGNVSMEAVAHELEDVTEKGSKEKAYLATDWEPHAIALVAVGADPHAQVLSSAEMFRCELISKETPMSDPIPAPTDEKSQVALAAEAAELLAAREDSRKVSEHIERDKDRKAQVKRATDYYELDDFWGADMVKSGLPIEKILELAVEERNRRKPKGPRDSGAGDTPETNHRRLVQMEQAVVARARHEEPPETARHYAHHTLVELAYECLSLKNKHLGLDVRVNGPRIVELALTTSDYPNLLANIATKLLLSDYDHAAPTYRQLAERMDLPDFKTASVLKVGDFPLPLIVGEGAEIQLGSFSEAKDIYFLSTYGRRLAFSFQSIVNDDLNAFQRVMRGAAIRLADFENGLWFTSFTSASGAGPTLGDGGALFNATAVTTAGGHANLTSSGTAIDVTSIGIGRAMMRRQVSLDGLKLNLTPRFILTSPEKETLARQYTTLIGPNVVPGSQNPWAGMLEPLADANLASANPWYLLADPSRAAISQYGYLQGMSGPDVATRVGFETLGVEMRVALHFGFCFSDFRGAYRNAGA